MDISWAMVEILVPVIAALVTGLALGWLIWGKAESEDPTAASVKSSVERRDKLSALETTLAEIQALTQKEKDRTRIALDELSSVEATVKNAQKTTSAVAAALSS
ncbi:MAG: hypothetical protein AAF742_08395 [Pseudomonadota bacterium]